MIGINYSVLPLFFKLYRLLDFVCPFMKSSKENSVLKLGVFPNVGQTHNINLRLRYSWPQPTWSTWVHQPPICKLWQCRFLGCCQFSMRYPIFSLWNLPYPVSALACFLNHLSAQIWPYKSHTAIQYSSKGHGSDITSWKPVHPMVVCN